VAYPWRNSGRAEVLAYGLARVLDTVAPAEVKGGHYQDHQAARLVRAERPRPADVRYAAWYEGSDLGVHS